MQALEIEIPTDADECLDRLGEAAEAWGGTWQREGLGGKLILPVIAGVRRGWVGGLVSVERRGDETLLLFRPEESVYRVQVPTVILLLVAAVSCLVLFLAPFRPVLLQVVPLALLVVMGTWFFVIAGLRNSGPEEFFESLTFNPSEVLGEEEP